MAQQTPPGLLALLSTASPPQHPSGSSHRAGVWGTFTHLPDKVLLGKGMLSYGKGLLLGFPSMPGVPTLPIPLHSPPTPPPGSCKSPFQQDFAGFSSLFSSFVCPAAGSNAWGWGRNHAWVLPSARTHAGEGSRWFGEGPPSSRPHPHPHCGLCGSPVTKNLLVWAARPRWQSWLPPPRCRARGVLWRTGIFSIFFFCLPGDFNFPPPVIAVFKPQRLDIRGPHTEVCVLPTGNRLRVAAATLLTGLLN